MFRKGEYKMDNEKVYSMSFSKIYPLLVNKAVKKGRSVEEVNQVIGWLTGYRTEEIEAAAVPVSYGDFSSRPGVESQQNIDQRCRLRRAGGKHPGTSDAGDPLS